MKHILTLLTILLFSQNLFADSKIYKWTTPDGVVHYSTQADEPKAKLAELPTISKGEFKVSSVQGITCDKHGGVNCRAGADIDGSVICFDGFTDASARFAFHCSAPKLRISDVSDPDPRGKFTVYVRNDRSVTAKDPSVTFTNEQGSAMKLKGPSEIAPFEMAEFTMYAANLAKAGQKPEYSQLSVSCSNCD